MEFILILGLFAAPPSSQYNSGSRSTFPPSMTSAEFKSKDACEKAGAAMVTKWKDAMDAQGMRLIYHCNPK